MTDKEEILERYGFQKSENKPLYFREWHGNKEYLDLRNGISIYAYDEDGGATDVSRSLRRIKRHINNLGKNQSLEKFENNGG